MRNHVREVRLATIALVSVTLALTRGVTAGTCEGAWNAAFELPGLTGSVNALAEYEGDLVAAGLFSGTGLPNIARRVGPTWAAVGAGLNGEVNALAVYNGELIAGGTFTTAGGGPANNVAAWDGATWAALGSGVDGTVKALTVYDGLLVAGGSFSNPGSRIAQWDGVSWQPLDVGTNGEVRALSVYDGELIAGGTFTSAGGAAAYRIARWDGSSWASLGTVEVGKSPEGVLVIHPHCGDLYVGGQLGFEVHGGGQGEYIAKWNGVNWFRVGDPGPHHFVNSMTSYRGDLIVGGQFTEVDNQVMNSIARWDGFTWQPVGAGVEAVGTASVRAMTPHRLKLIVGGVIAQAGGAPDVGIARWVPRLADLDGDCTVGIVDLLELLGDWGP